MHRFFLSVLFQHAVSHARVFEADSSFIKPILFVTVSPHLKKDLTQRFEEIKTVEDVNLPQIMFLSLNELLDTKSEESTRHHA
jgi:hypothetical protein